MRIPDFTGADWDGGELFVLFRNGEIINTLHRTADGWSEGDEAWSFAKVMDDGGWRYADETFGKAEGLAVTHDRFYVVLDNNGNARKNDSEDRRPLLLILERPS